MYEKLNQDKALIWRIIHRNNLAWILDNGLYSGNSSTKYDEWVNIGHKELISKRAIHPVPIAPGGVLNDYIPFYFTPFSVMMLNIKTGYNVKQRPNDEIVILVSSLPHLQKKGVQFIFTDQHAYYKWAGFYGDLDDLDKVDWHILQNRDFKRDPDDPGKFERYQAEALAHQHCPIEGLKGIVCYTDKVRQKVQKMVDKRGLNLKVFLRPGWYF